MTDTKHPEALRLAALYDADAWPGGLSLNAWAAASAAELRRLHAENTTLQQGYDAARLEIDHLRGATKMVEPAQPVAWLVYLPSIDTQHLYYSQEDMGYVDDVTNHADAEVTPLYEMAAPKAEVAPSGEYPPLPTPDSYLFQHEETGVTQYVDSQQVEWGFENNNPRLQRIGGAFTEAQMRAYVDADRAMRAQAAPVAVAVPSYPSITLDFKQAAELLKMFGGEPGLVTLQQGDARSHSGAGLYAYYSELPEEGAEFLGPEPDDEAAPTNQTSPQPPVAAQEPAAYLEKITGRICEADDVHRRKFPACYVPLYTHPAQQPSPAAQGDAKDAARYRLLRRGQHWSVINGTGDTLRADELDTAIDAARARAKEGA